MAEAKLHPGSIAFLMAFHDQAEAKLDATFNGRVKLTLSGPCSEYPELTRFAVEVRGEADAEAGHQWMTDIRDSLRGVVGGPIHVCVG